MAMQDTEKYSPSTSLQFEEKVPDVLVSEAVGPKFTVERLFRRVTAQLSQWGLEVNGIVPIPLEERTDPRLYQMFMVWFSANANILILSAGTVGPAFYGLGIKDSLLIILVVDIVTCAFPAFFAVFGPKLGTRAMVQSRFSWGYYGAIIPSVLNVLSMQGYLILNAIIGGQTLAGVSTHLNASLGIVIIGIISLAVSTSSTSVYETVIWIPNVIAFIVMLGVGGKNLVNAPLSSPLPLDTATILTFGATLTATNVSWSTVTPDYGVYHNAKASSWRIFIYAYLGFLLASMPAHMLGAAFTAASVSVPAWKAGLGDGNDVGGLIAAILAPTGRFGKFMLVLTALTAPSACAPTMYTVCTSFMTIAPIFAKIPRFVIATISTAILIPVAIVGSTRFYTTFVDIQSLIGYWLAPFCAIVLTEHFVFRRGPWSSYDVLEAWDKPQHPNLPRGYAAAVTLAISIGLIVVCMQQAWWTGPVARKGTGDVGMLVGFVGSVAVYLCARWLEKRWTKTR
ncbi:Purine-cytosine permease fcyB [Grifola frondosa]|uniref:Purine-cytosine permease fcyB n=1 Tax=Grifola frondosa TaxID=5627 RepID=A0A1C7LLJ5_GRIFR|nr:Purine-cytosine permease fcyB [Grifola frondosa]